MKKIKRFILEYVLSAVLLSGCASSSTGIYRTYEQKSLLDNSNAALLLAQGLNVGFRSEDGIFAKINGKVLREGTIDFLIDVDNTSTEVICIVKVGNRGLIGLNKKAVKATIEYKFEAGKTYVLEIHESGGTRAGAMFLGVFVPPSFEYTLYAGPVVDKKNILLNGKMEKLNSREIKLVGQQSQQTYVGNYTANQPVSSGIQNPPPLPVSAQYLLSISGEQFGPYDIDELRQMVQLRTLTRETLVWKDGMAQWAPAGTVQELSTLFGVANPPPLPQSR
jgi:hypothetical protein